MYTHEHAHAHAHTYAHTHLRFDSSPANAVRMACFSSSPLWPWPASSIRVASSRRSSFESPRNSFGRLDGIGCGQ